MAIETPIQVLQRVREQAKRERLARAQQPYQQFLAASTPADKATAFGAQIGTALAQAFAPEQNLEESPEVIQAQQRQQWLSVDPGNADQIKVNLKAAADAGDYEVANYLTDLYYKARTLDLQTQKQAIDAQPRAEEFKLQGDFGKNLEDARKLRALGRNEEADIIEQQVANKKAEQEAETYKKRREEADVILAQSFGMNLEKDLDSADVTGPFQAIADSFADRSVYAGEKMADIKRDMQKYFKYNAGYLDDQIEFTQPAIEEVKAGKIGFGYDSKAGRYGMYTLKEGVPTKLISWVDGDMIDRYGIEKDPTLGKY